ncbi:MAG: hypothetical protein Q4F67_03920 [Propionibacteriaceae bacterium]|nr:hypothetical protein [Propionibacteriaceae bacterium]
MTERLPDDDLNIPGPPSVQHWGDSVTTGKLPMGQGSGPKPRPVRTPLVRWLAIFIAGIAVVGCLAGGLWASIAPVPTYQVNADGFATTSERGLAGFVAGDAWFVLIGLALGALCGVVAWWWFAGLGWRVVPLAMVGATVMGLLCWQVGWWLGPGPFEPRLATASPGAILEIELTVRGPAALLVWPFAAVLVLMLISALAPDPEEDRRRRPADR